jgi:hypothetical protein
MPKRPQISDELHSLVHDIHEEYTGERSNGFEPALETVTQLAEAQILDRDVTDPGWYPGKYLSEVVERLSNRSSGMDRSAPTAVESTQQAGTSVDPDTQAVFKTVLKQDGTVTIPEAEIAALNLTEGELLQVIAYSIEDE